VGVVAGVVALAVPACGPLGLLGSAVGALALADVTRTGAAFLAGALSS
jgi:hypothetical protein